MRYLLLAIAAFILAVLPATAAELLIVQSQRHPAYDQAVQLIRSSCSSSETLVMSDYAEFDLGRIEREEQPRLLVAVGEQAFLEARKLRRTPVVYSMTLDVDENSLPGNVTGITMHVAADKYMQLFNKLQLQRVGVLYDPGINGAYLQRAHRAAAEAGVELVVLAVHSPQEVPAALDRMKELAVDSLWMIPDSTAVAPENFDAYFRFARQENLPVISFARGYLSKGAAVVLEGTRTSMARQSCSMIRKILGGTDIADLTSVDISEAILNINQNVAGKLNLKVSALGQLFPAEQRVTQ